MAETTTIEWCDSTWRQADGSLAYKRWQDYVPGRRELKT